MISEESGQQDMMMPIFQKKDEIKIHLSRTAIKQAEQVTQNSELGCLINNHLDLYSKAEPQICECQVVDQKIFKHYFLKHKYRDQKSKVFDQVRNLLIDRGYTQISQISDKQQQQIMVVRVIAKVQNALNTFTIEDQFNREKLVVKQGIMWVGMICGIRAKWSQGNYKLDKIIDLSMPIPQVKAHLSANMSVNRIMFIKGPFRAKFSNQDAGIRILSNQIRKLKKKNIIINELVVMGPILSKNNNNVKNFNLQRTYEEQFQYIIATLRNQMNQINPDMLIYVIPSLDDITSLYPIPQPAYSSQNKKIKVKYLGNPASINILGRRSVCKIDFVNYDVLKFIDTHKAGKNTKQLRQQNMETYIKQPFFLTNTISHQDPIDEVNIDNLYNAGNFGDLVVFSSNQSPPFVNSVNGRIILNIGSLGIDSSNLANKSYIVFASIYEGEGPVSQRIKVQTISSS